jgi:hypothetical protein
MPTIVEQANALYAKFLEESTVEEVQGTKFTVWRGKLVETCLSVGIKYGSYRKIVTSLEHIRSIQILETGNRGMPTTLLLVEAPTENRWVAPPLTKVSEDAKLSSDARAIIESLGGLDVAKVLVNFEDRLKRLEKRLATLEGSSGKK